MNLISFVRKLILILPLIFLFACDKRENDSHSVEERTININGDTYYYSIAVPTDYSESKEYSVILGLHWGEPVYFQTGVTFLNTFLLPTLEDYDGIIISPSCPEESGWIQENSQNFIISLIEQIKTDYNVNSSKIAIIGYSMGGIGTWFYAVNNSNIFSLALPIASKPSSAILPIDKIIPTYVIHGENDELFPLSTIKEIVKNIKTKNNIINLIEVENASHYDTDKYKDALSKALDWIEDKWSD